MQTKAGIERAVAAFLEKAPKAPAIADRGNQGLKTARVHAAIGSAQAPVNPAINKSGEQLFGATEQDPLRGQKVPTSNRQRGAIPLAPPSWRDPLRGSRCRSSPPFGGAKSKRAE
jgi:hypothetical protein